MNKIFINKANSFIDLDSNINVIDVCDQLTYRDLSFNIKESLSIFLGNDVLDFNKILVIYNPFEISCDDRRITNCIYKKLISMIRDEEKSDISILETTFIDLIERLLLKTNIPVDYNESIDVEKMFSSFGLKIKESNYDNYLEVLNTYININTELSGTKAIVSFGITNLLTNEELLLMEKELLLKEVILIDFKYNNTSINSKAIIDDEWCIF